MAAKNFEEANFESSTRFHPLPNEQSLPAVIRSDELAASLEYLRRDRTT